MTTPLIDFPFRLSPNGTVVTLLDGDPDYFAHELTVLVTTVPGEREMVPEYGMEDPAYDVFSSAQLDIQISKFGPPVVINSVTSTVTDDTTINYEIDFDLAPTDLEDDYDDYNGGLVG